MPTVPSPSSFSAPLSPLRIGYVAPSEAQAVQSLASIGFGAGAPADAFVRVPLAPLPQGETRVEVWQVPGDIGEGVTEGIRWRESADYLFFALELDEAASGGIEAAAEQAYTALHRLVDRHDKPHVLRFWNYLDAINEGEGDAERYRQFCAGRARAMAPWASIGYPAATAIGSLDGERRLQVYGLAARHAGTPIENPRQVSAWRYPRQYGPIAPTFARAMRTDANQLLVSGTAAVVGHASQHIGDVAAQIAETWANLEAVIAAAAQGRSGFGDDLLLKAYVRDASLCAPIAGFLRTHLPERRVDVLFLHGHICRHELLLEIDGALDVMPRG